MAFDTISKHKFSNLPNTFLENPIKQPHLRNGFYTGGSSSKLLPHHLIGPESCRGSSMINPFSGLHNPLLNRYSSGGVVSAPELPEAGVTGGVVHEVVQGNKGVLNYSVGTNHQQVYWTPPAIFQEPGNGGGFVEDFWCLAPENGREKKQIDVMKKKKKRRVQERKASKLRKKLNVVKGQWTPQEDCLLIQMVLNYGEKKWSEIAKHLNGRVGKQCRERWHNHLRPNIKI